MQNIYDFLEELCQKYAENIFWDNKITYREAFNLIKARAAFLQQEGYQKGDIIAVLAANSADWCISFLANTIAGCASLNLDTNLPLETLKTMISQVNTKAVFISDEFKDLKIADCKIYDITEHTAIDNAKNYQKPLLNENDLAILLYTSGTTGDPKIVQLTHANFFKTSRDACQHMKLTTYAFLNLLPLYHVYGLMANLGGAMAAGCSFVFQPSLKGPDILKSLKENKIEVIPGVPQLWEIFLDNIISKVKNTSTLKYGLFMFFLNNGHILKAIGLKKVVAKIFKPVHDVFGGNIRFFISGGASLKKQYLKFYNNMGFKIIEGYGLTETTGPACLTTLDQVIPGSVGKPVPGNEITIKNINDDGIGEIWMRGNAVFIGYYKNPEKTAEVFDNEGWFNTGDLGYLDKDNNLYITGRAKNVIVLDSGKNVYPEELEAYYQTSPLIKEIAVFGRKINDTEKVYAVIVPETPNASCFTEIKKELAEMNQKLPSYKIVSEFALSLEPLPRTSTKKFIIREIISLLEKKSFITGEEKNNIPQKEVSATNDKEKAIIETLQKLLNRNKFYEYQTLQDLDLDSLKTIDLIVKIEESLKITINSDAFTSLPNIKTIIEYLLSCPQNNGELENDLLAGKIKTRTVIIFNPLVELFILLGKFISNHFWQLKITNRDKLVLNNNIIVANHQSYLDIIWILASLSYAERKHIFMIGKKELSFLRFIFPGLRTIFIEKKGNVMGTLKAGADVLRLGKSLLIFPEGTRTMDGRLSGFKTGAAYLAFKLQKEILPLVIKGAYQIYPRQKRLPTFKTKYTGEIIVLDKVNPKKYNSVEDLNNGIYNMINQQLK